MDLIEGENRASGGNSRHSRMALLYTYISIQSLKSFIQNTFRLHSIREKFSGIKTPDPAVKPHKNSTHESIQHSKAIGSVTKTMAARRDSATTRSMSRLAREASQNTTANAQPAPNAHAPPTPTGNATRNTLERRRSVTTRSMSRAQGQEAEQAPVACGPAAPPPTTDVTGRQGSAVTRAGMSRLEHAEGAGESLVVAVNVPGATVPVASTPTKLTGNARRGAIERRESVTTRAMSQRGLHAEDRATTATLNAQAASATTPTPGVSKTSRPSSARRSRSPSTLREPNRVRENPAPRVLATPKSSGPSLATPLTTIRNHAATAALSSSDLSKPRPSSPSLSIEEQNTLLTCVHIGARRWVAAGQSRHIVADASTSQDTDRRQRQVDNPRIPVRGSTATQNVEPVGVLDSEWLQGHPETDADENVEPIGVLGGKWFERLHDTGTDETAISRYALLSETNTGADEDSRPRYAQADDVETMTGHGLQNITDAYYHAGQGMIDGLPSSILLRISEERLNCLEDGFGDTPADLELIRDLYLPFRGQSQVATIPPAPSDTVPDHYDTPDLCADERCPIEHLHEEGMYIARAQVQRTWHEQWGYSDPPQEIWEAWDAIVKGTATDEQCAMVHGFAECHFWPGTE